VSQGGGCWVPKFGRDNKEKAKPYEIGCTPVLTGSHVFPSLAPRTQLLRGETTLMEISVRITGVETKGLKDAGTPLASFGWKRRVS
jgi:hypothetical protein